MFGYIGELGSDLPDKFQNSAAEFMVRVQNNAEPPARVGLSLWVRREQHLTEGHEFFCFLIMGAPEIGTILLQVLHDLIEPGGIRRIVRGANVFEGTHHLSFALKEALEGLDPFHRPFGKCFGHLCCYKVWAKVNLNFCLSNGKN